MLSRSNVKEVLNLCSMKIINVTSILIHNFKSNAKINSYYYQSIHKNKSKKYHLKKISESYWDDK